MEERSYLSESGNKEASLLFELQHRILSLSETSLQETVDFCESSIFVTDENRNKDIVYVVMNALVCRPLNTDILARFVNKILSEKNEAHLNLWRLFLSKISAPAYCDLSHLVFYRKLLDLGTFTASDIVKQIEFFFMNFPPALVCHIILFAWFTPEIEQVSPTHYDRIISIARTTPLIRTRPDILHFFENLESFKRNDFELWKKCMLTNDQPDGLTLKIREDDVDALREMFAENPAMDVNQRIPPFMFGVSSFLTCFPTLVQYAAFVGASKCVKFLVESGADLSLVDKCHTTLAQFAVAGGNLEIIKYLDGHVNFNGCLSAAAKFFQNTVYSWLANAKYTDTQAPDFKNLSPIHYAAESGNIEILLRCLDEGQDVNLSNHSGWTPLHIASKNGQFLIIEILYAHKDIKVTKSDAKGWTALHWAANNCHPQSCRVLMNSEDCDVNAMDVDGHTPLHWAAIKGYPEVVNVLLSNKNINVNIRNIDGSSPLHRAAACGNARAVKELLSFDGIDVNIRDDYDATPLYLACENGQVEVVNLLVNHPNINVNQPDNHGETPLFAISSLNNQRKKETMEALFTNQDVDVNAVKAGGATPLHVFAKDGDEESLLLLLSKPEINRDVRDSFGWTPLHFAASAGNSQTIKVLLDKEVCDVNSVDEQGKTALFWAIDSILSENESFDPFIATKLLISLTDVNIKNALGQTILHFAMNITNQEALEYILSVQEIDLNAQDNEGKTALHIAIEKNNETAVGILLANENVAIDIKDNNGRTPLHAAAISGSKNILEAIIERCSDNLNVRDNNSATPLMLAAEFGIIESVKILVNAPGVDTNVADSSGRSIRVNALLKGFTEIASILKNARPCK